MDKQISPGIFNAFIFLSIALHFIFPIKLILDPPYTYFGLVIVLTGLGMNFWAVNLLKKEKTTTEYKDLPVKLVTSGPFTVSRNPIYLGGVIILLGFAWWLGSVISFVFPILLFVILNWFYIPNEEKRLQMIFGERYLKYKQSARRWF